MLLIDKAYKTPVARLIAHNNHFGAMKTFYNLRQQGYTTHAAAFWTMCKHAGDYVEFEARKNRYSIYGKQP